MELKRAAAPLRTSIRPSRGPNYEGFVKTRTGYIAATKALKDAARIYNDMYQPDRPAGHIKPVKNHPAGPAWDFHYSPMTGPLRFTVKGNKLVSEQINGEANRRTYPIPASLDRSDPAALRMVILRAILLQNSP